MEKVLLCILWLSFFYGCTSVTAPQGIDNKIFSQTKKIELKLKKNSEGIKSLTFIEGPSVKIKEHPDSEWFLMKFKDRYENIRFRLMYKCLGIWVEKAIATHANIDLNTDLIKQEDIDGYVLETGAIDLDRNFLDKSLNTGITIVLYSKGDGTVVTLTDKMIRDEKRGDWDAIGRMLDNGEGYKSKYTKDSITIEVSDIYLKAFLKRADMLKI